ncbi:hypothetical protein [Dielma fastidiosa]|uniref:hypothetical protein n=1 Tax=Dielma fastidiosa TaxID=1034346 RepID=UPI0035626E7D
MATENKKKFKKNYKLTLMFIIVIFVLIIICFGTAFCLAYDSFWMSFFLNIGGGLITGLIILIYQLFTDKKKNHMQKIIEQMNKLIMFENFVLAKKDFWDEEFAYNEDNKNMQNAPIFCSNEQLCLVLDLCKKRISELMTNKENLKRFYNEIYTFQYSLSYFSELLSNAKKYFDQFDSEIEYGFQPEYDEKGNVITLEAPDGDIITEGYTVKINILKYLGCEVEQQSEETCIKWMTLIRELNEEALKINNAIVKEREEAIKYFNNTMLF